MANQRKSSILRGSRNRAMPITKNKPDFLTLVRSYLTPGTKPRPAQWAVVRDMADTKKRIQKATKKSAHHHLITV